MRLPGRTATVLVALTAAGGLAALAAPESRAASAPDGRDSISGSALAAHIAVLASDAFEGRAPGTAGERKTLDYLTAELTRLKVAPGVGSSYLQPVPLVAMTPSADPTFVLTGHDASLTLAAPEDFVARPGRPTAAIEIRDAPVVFAGYGIRATEYGWDDYAGVDVRGAIVVVIRGEPSADNDPAFFRGRALTLHGFDKSALAGRLGARAVVVIHTEASTGYPWSLVSGGGGGRASMMLADRAGAPQPDIIAQVSEPTARRLLATAGLSLDNLVASANRRGFTAVRTGLRARFTWQGQLRTVLSHNVIARIPGREAADECVIYTAHWDHVGRNGALAGDQIFNGAVDNATGTAALLALAQAFQQLPQPPRRSIYLLPRPPRNRDCSAPSTTRATRCVAWPRRWRY